MNNERFAKCERKNMDRILNFRLPYSFKKIGILLFIIAFCLMIVKTWFPEHTSMLREISKKGIVIAMLIISLARDKEEDELIVQLRAQSYAIAFIVGVIYALIMPYVDYGVSNIIKPEGEAYKDLGDFQILIFMLMIQLIYYHVLKRYR